MNFYPLFGRLGRIIIATVLLITAVNYVQESLCDIKVVEIARNIEGEFSIQFDEIGVKLALNDSTFMLKVEA
ncbi:MULTISPECIES: hypothetical protein [Sphingobacterium]|uniref:Uncharacterized protein n=1 Tax=Sphingobacterium litopenaei TaxID=2763500 RepID=A0ABR7YDZ6_9SPHI|nr:MULTISPECIES: hypothetical protein [Sphingobacterium]MBD1429516.1 hypothetical protein [Sphingobacterium litopenaei]NGM72692.1 hypothetical protein [Sphingobacterium sp. SGL-16]